mgnify:CR=1 FL=1
MKSGNFPFPGFTEWEEIMSSCYIYYYSLLALPKLKQISNSIVKAYSEVYKYYGYEVSKGITYDRETGNFPILTVLTVSNHYNRLNDLKE